NTLNQNPELFVNDGPPGSPTQAGSVTDAKGNTYFPEYLYLVNGVDDNGDGFVDNGWDGFDNNYNFIIDEYAGWINPATSQPIETEQWTGTEFTILALNPLGLRSIPYTILRRPTPVAGSREVTLPGGIVIDATTWNSTQERSRLPIDPKTLYVDI